MRVRARAPALSPKLRSVALFFDRNRLEVLSRTAAEMAAMIGTSDATVVRAARALGFSGLPELKRAIVDAMGAGPSHARNLQRALASVKADVEGAIDLVLGHEARLIATISAGPRREAISEAVAVLNEARRVVVFGTGNSGLIAEYVARMLARHGRPMLLLSASGLDLAEQMLTFDRGDALLMLFFGRSYPEVEVVAEEAAARGLPLVLVTESADKPLAGQARVVLEIRRDGPDGTPLHGATLTCLEAVIMGLAAIEQQRAVASLTRLQSLRERIVRRRVSGRQARRPEGA